MVGCHCVVKSERMANVVKNMREYDNYNETTLAEVMLMKQVVAESLCAIYDYIRETSHDTARNETETLEYLEERYTDRMRHFLARGEFIDRDSLRDRTEWSMKASDSQINLEFFEGIFYRWFDELESSHSLSYYHFSLLDRNEVFAHW